MAQPLLEGNVDNRDALIEQLQAQVDTLDGELRRTQAELMQAKRSSAAAVAGLRHQLSPLYQALQVLFGEIDKVEPLETGPSMAAAKNSAVWESWKQRLGGKQAEFIDLLLTHREMTAAQLKAAARCATKTVYDVIFKMNRAGILNKNGGRFSLKEL